MRKKTPLVMREKRYFLNPETKKNGIDSLGFDRECRLPHHKKRKTPLVLIEARYSLAQKRRKTPVEASCFNTRDRLLLSRQSGKTPPVQTPDKGGTLSVQREGRDSL
jgi:hypothetical protein